MLLAALALTLFLRAHSRLRGETGGYCHAGQKMDGKEHSVRLSKRNPAVEIGDDETLTVIRYDERIGFYPKGAWISYRSD